MERLTSKYWRNLDPWEMCGQDNYCKRGCHDQGGCTKGCIVPRIYARLASYEDSGLEPEDMAHWMDYFRAECEGRLVVLPCKVGDAAYWLHNGIITECRVHRIQMNRTGMFICLKSKVSHGAFRVDTCLGKTVFLTREEAALARKEIPNNETRKSI